MKSTLYNYLINKHHSNLELVDAVTGNHHSFNDILEELPELSTRKKRLVFLYLDNSIESVKILLACIKSNHALCLLSATLKIEFKQRLEELYKPSYVFDHSRSSDGKNESIIYSGNNIKGYELNDGLYEIHPDVKILLSTSGTTGSPKFVKLTDHNFISNTESIIEYMPIRSDDVCILNLPIHYSYGLSVLLTNIASGGKIICTDESIMSRNFWTIFENYKCTSISGVPYTYEMLFRIGFTKNKSNSIRYLSQAGGKLNITLLRTFADYAKDNGIDFYVMYGQTEATARMSYLSPEQLDEKIGSIGKPIKGGKFLIEPASGELIYEGPNVGCGYVNNIDDLKVCEYLKSLHTGDIATVDKDGYYYITGRMKRFVKLFGNRISLDELENDLKGKYNHFVGCTAIEDRKLLIFSDNEYIEKSEIVNYIANKYQIHVSVIKYIFTANIPLTANEKIDYRAIIDQNG